MKKSILFTLMMVLFSVIIMAQPPAPPAPTVSTNLCGPKILSSVSAPTNVTYYWQGTSCGTSTANSAASTYTATASGSYFLRAYNTAGLWSSTCSYVYVDYNAYPATPATPTVSANTCGAKLITRVANPPAGVGYYWQGTSCGSLTTDVTPDYMATATGSYYLQAISSTGCASACASVYVVVNMRPATPAAPTASANLCGDKILTATGVAPADIVYYWQGTSCGTSTGNDAVNTYTATASGSYYINAVHTSSGCWSSSCNWVDVTVNPLPTVSFSGLAASYLDNEGDVTLTGSPAGGVFTGTGITGNVFNPTTAGPGDFVITYTYTDLAGCANFDAQMVHVDHFDGISTIDYSKYISVYPNPLQGTLNIEIKALPNEEVNYTIVNLMGESVRTGTFVNSHVQQIDLTSLDNGVYFIRLQNEDMNYVHKIIVQK